MDIIKDEKVLKIVEKIKNAIKLTRFENHVFLVGGVVRDSLLGIKPTDVDVVCDIKAGGLMVANLLAAREKCYVCGSNPVVYETYGTAKVRLFKDPDLKEFDIEFVETRKNKTEFGTLEEDSKRRDLTINALYWNITNGKLYDFNQSIDDLVNKTLRCPAVLI